MCNLQIETIDELAAVPQMHHVISTRHGGVSIGEYATLNLGYHVGDDPACVSENRRRLGMAGGYDPDRLVAAQQIHGTTITRIDASHAGRGAYGWDDAILQVDGLWTTVRHLPLAIQVADCAPVLIADPVCGALAVVHAGWRGALGRIASSAVACMRAEAGANPARMVAGIGPALCPACLEVGEEVAVAVRNVFPGYLLADQATPHLDLRGMIAHDLAAAGLPSAHISAHLGCTRCQSQRYFSHRGQRGSAGRGMLVAWLA